MSCLIPGKNSHTNTDRLFIRAWQSHTVAFNFSHARTQEKIHEQDIAGVLLYIPMRINARWAKYHNLLHRDVYKYDITTIVKKANIRVDEFKKCWFYVKSRLSDDELFSLFKDSGFSPKGLQEMSSRLDFVKNVVQRYKDTMVFLGLLLACISVVYGCVHLLVYTYFSLAPPTLKLTNYRAHIHSNVP